MKQVVLLVFFFISIVSFAQKSVDARLVLRNKDTIYTQLKVTTNLFSKKLIEPRSFYSVLTLLDNQRNKEAKKIYASEVKELRFIDFKDQERCFILYDYKDDRLIELLFDGQKIKWYRRHYVNSHDGAMKHHDFLLDASGEVYNMGLLANVRKKLKQATQSKPELVEKIDEMRIRDAQILTLLQQYEE